MDGFQVRLQLVNILRKLSSSQNSIQSTVRFLLKHKDKHGEDLWDCLVEEAEKVNLNARINILYLIDGLLFTSCTALLTSQADYYYAQTPHPKKPRLSEQPTAGPQASSSSSSNGGFNYGYLIKKDLVKLVELVVPTSFNRKGLLNLMSTAQVLKNWRAQLPIIDPFLDAQLLDQIDLLLSRRKQTLGKADVDPVGPDNHELLDFSKKEILDRIDDDRERHKRLRERMWVLPIPSISGLMPKVGTVAHPAATYVQHRSATLLHTSLNGGVPADDDEPHHHHPHRLLLLQQPPAGPIAPLVQFDRTISLECDQLIHALSEDSPPLHPSDWAAIKRENSRCFAPPLSLDHHFRDFS